jgi:methionyl aminopeptidase
MEKSEIEKILKAGEIAKQIKSELNGIVKKDKLLLEIAKEIESRIFELEGKPAFPVNLSINEIAAHYTPSYDDGTKAEGLLKVDFGVSIEGFVADTAVSFDLEGSEENKKLIETAKKCLEGGIEEVTNGKSLAEIGKRIQSEAEKDDFSPIKNLSGHSIDKGNLHSGITIPNYDNGYDAVLDEGIYAIEPFVTKGVGMVRDGKPSGIYEVIKESVAIRDNKAREVFKFILEEYEGLPFCSRWLVEKFGTRVLISLAQIERAGGLHQFNQLVEKSGAKVAQAENTILIFEDEIIVTSE